MNKEMVGEGKWNNRSFIEKDKEVLVYVEQNETKSKLWALCKQTEFFI